MAVSGFQEKKRLHGTLRSRLGTLLKSLFTLFYLPVKEVEKETSILLGGAESSHCKGAYIYRWEEMIAIATCHTLSSVQLKLSLSISFVF